jgi:hypothetical protein
MAADATAVRAGVENLVRHCLNAAPGESILLLNEHGGVDAGLVSLMEEVITSVGAKAYSLWIDPLARGSRELPSVVGAAVLATDKLVMNANVNRVVLLEHLKANGQAAHVRINNRMRTPERMASEHARFDWRLVMALAGRVEEITAQARSYRITTPAGTDLSGRVVGPTEVADSFFAQDAELSRTERVFPGEVYAPVGSGEAQGTVAFDHPGLASKEPFPSALLLSIKDNMLTGLEWAGAAPTEVKDGDTQTVWSKEQFEGLLAANEAKAGREKAYIVDSWHGGMHPRAEKRPGQLSEPRTMHVHIGRLANTLSAYLSDQTVVLDGERTMFENGSLSLLKEPDFQALAGEYGVKL